MENKEEALLDAQAELWNHIFSFLKSMCLKCAVELSIPDAMQKQNKPITLSELATAISIPNSKIKYLNRVMRMLTHSGFFKVQDNEEEMYSLTPLSHLLVRNNEGENLSPFVRAMLTPILIEPSLSMSSWLKSEVSTEQVPFSKVHGTDIWGMLKANSQFGQVFNEAMACDGQFGMDVLLKNHGEIFEGVKSLVDVGGGSGGTVAAISKVFTEMKCTVLDLPHVVGNLESAGNVHFVAGDMFEYVPPADVVLLKVSCRGP